MIYFTSDQHLGHPAIISMQNRPFQNVEDMNQTIINNYNSIVHKDDTVYILGDICHRLRVEEANDLISGLKGRKILITGNHENMTSDYSRESMILKQYLCMGNILH